MTKSNISGARIKYARERKGWQTKELVAALSTKYHLDLTPLEMTSMEEQKREIKDFELDAIARILQVNPEWLLRGEEKT